jgi:pimeloyl-ACP methyl ester carboxylesterase
MISIFFKPEGFIVESLKKNIMNKISTVIATLGDFVCLPAAAVSVFYSYFIENQDSPCPKVNHPAILLIHGSSGNHGTMAYGVARLSKDFPHSVFTVQYDGVLVTDKHKSIDEYIPLITKKCQEIQYKTQQNRIFLVGHSLGGLLAARFVQKEAYKYNIDVPAIVTIGSPWRGSHLINKIWSVGKAKRRLEDMRPESIFLQDLNQELSKNTRYFCIGSTDDLLVPYVQAIPERRSLQHADHLKLQGVGHYTLIVFPVVWDFVEDVITRFI